MKTTYQILAATLAGAVAAFLLLAVIFPPKAHASGAVKLLDEPCRLTEMVTNLPLRATWTEDGKVYEGCWGRHHQAPNLIVTFWEDRTVVPILDDEVRRIDVQPALSI